MRCVVILQVPNFSYSFKRDVRCAERRADSRRTISGRYQADEDEGKRRQEWRTIERREKHVVRDTHGPYLIVTSGMAFALRGLSAFSRDLSPRTLSYVLTVSLPR